MAEQKEKKNRIAEVMNHEWKYENLRNFVQKMRFLC